MHRIARATATLAAVCAAIVVAPLTSIAPADARTWFEQVANIPTLTPATADDGDPVAGAPKNKGGEAAAIFDANHDGVPDIVIANGTSYYFVALGRREHGGSVSYAPRAFPIGVTGDGRKSAAKALGLTDFNGDGRLDLYLANNGDGSLALKNPRDLQHAYDPANLDRSRLPQDHRYRSYLSLGNGRFAYKDLGADAHGDTRSALFADFDGDGNQDLFAFNAPYFGVWWGGDPSPSQLLPGKPHGRFSANRLPSAVVDTRGHLERHLLEDRRGRGDVDVKGAITRDFDGDGKPDVIASAYSDVWDNIGRPPLAPAEPAGGKVDLDRDGVPDGGYQGVWRHGILVLRNISKPGHIRFRDVSRTAVDQPLGRGDRMNVYETIPIDFNHDGKLDLVATGVRNFTAFDSLAYRTPLIRLYRNDSKQGHLRFTDVTKGSGLDFLNHNASLRKATGGRYPITIPHAMQGGGDAVFTPLLSAGAGVDIDNDGNPDIVLIDRQFTSTNPLTGQEFSPWTFLGEGKGKFKWVRSSVTGLVHTGRDITYGDLNGDGREDLVTVNGSGGGQSVDDDNYVWLNRIRNHNGWIDLRIHSERNPLGLGARVTVYRAGTRHIVGDDELRTDFAYRSRRDAQLHFGLGHIHCVDVRVTGLGRAFTVPGLRADQVKTIRLPRDRSATPEKGCRPGTERPAAAAARAGRSAIAVPAVRQPLATDPRSSVAHDTEVMALVGHSGRLFAATDQWEYPGRSPAGQVLVKPSRYAHWKVFEGAASGRVEALNSFRIPPHQGFGARRSHSLLITQVVTHRHSEIQWLRDRQTSFRHSYALPARTAKVRAFGAHRSGGSWDVYAGVTPDGILRGTWAPDRRTLVFHSRPELAPAPPASRGQKTQKVTGFADCGGALYASINTKLYRRNDGTLAPGVSRWVQVYDEGRVGAFNSGLRGLTCVRHDGTPALLVSTERSGDIYRFDHLPRGRLDKPGTARAPGALAKQWHPRRELSPTSAIRKMLAAEGTRVPASGPGSIDYVIAAYNDFARVRIDGVRRQLFGFEWHYNGACAPSRTCTPSGWDAAACFGMRTDRGRSPSFVLRCLGGRDFTPAARVTTPVRSGQAFVSIRTIARSPFGDGRIYYGGYDCDFYPADGTAWVGSSAARSIVGRGPAGTSPWVRDTVNALDVWLPDANSDYYLGGFGTANGARTIIEGRVPAARYWSYTAYPVPPGGPVAHIYDRKIARVHGRYTLTIAASCAHVRSTCIATTGAGPAGIAVLRLYVPDDLAGRGTGAVPLPRISYRDAGGSRISLTQAAGTESIQRILESYRRQHGALPPELRRRYPAPRPVPDPVIDPPPRGRISHGTGAFNNPDNAYEHIHFTTRRGNLVVSATAPTYRADSFKAANDLARPARESPQVRYWSLCIVLAGLHTGDCLRDEQIRFPRRSRRFTAIVAPHCPVAGYRNCLKAGPEPIQVSVAYRLLLPSKRFARRAFKGPFELNAKYVARRR